MSFDPTQPFTVEDEPKITKTGGFDPTKPFEVEPSRQPEAAFAPSRLDDYEARAARVAGAAAQGFRDTPPILTPFAEKWLRDRGAGPNIIGFINSPSYALGLANAAFRGTQQQVMETLMPVIGQQAARDLAAIPEAFMGMPEALRTPRAGEGAVRPPRAEPGFPEPPAGPTPLLGGPPTEPAPGGGGSPRAPRTGASLEEAGITPTAEPIPAAETETIAQINPDGTVTKVQVKTGEPPPPGEPPKRPHADAINPDKVSDADFRAMFPGLSDEQFAALFQKASQEVSWIPAPDGIPAWLKDIRSAMLYLGGVSRPDAEEQPPASSAASSRLIPPGPEPEAAEVPTTAPEPSLKPPAQEPTPVAEPVQGEVLTKSDLWKMPREQLEAMLTEKTESDHQKLVRALGSEEAAKEFQRLDRKQNSTDPKRSDEGRKEFDAKFGNLTPDQERLIYGIGETDAQQDDIKTVLDAHGQRHGNAADAAYEAASAIRAAPAKDILAVPGGGQSPTAQGAFVRLKNAYDDMLTAGVSPDQIGMAIVGALVERGGWKPGDATAVVGGFLEQMRAGRQPSVPQLAGPVEAHGGPWSPVLDKDGRPSKNRQGEPVFENANGVRALMENGVPYHESATMDPEKGLVPRNAVDRRGQFLTVDETGLGAAPPKTKGRIPAKDGGEVGEMEAQPAEKPKVESVLKPVAEKPAKPEWTKIGENADGQTVYANEAGVHSTVQDGVRSVEPVRMRPTKEGMRVSVPAPADKAPEFQVVPEEPKAESGTKSSQKRPENEAISPTSGSPTTKEEPKPEASVKSTPEAPPVSTPAEKPSTEVAKPDAPTEHPGLRIKSLETGKETVIQPPGTVAPAVRKHLMAKTRDEFETAYHERQRQEPPISSRPEYVKRLADELDAMSDTVLGKKRLMDELRKDPANFDREIVRAELDRLVDGDHIEETPLVRAWLHGEEGGYSHLELRNAWNTYLSFLYPPEYLERVRTGKHADYPVTVDGEIETLRRVLAQPPGTVDPTLGVAPRLAERMATEDNLAVIEQMRPANDLVATPDAAPETVIHVTKKGKTLTGTIRRDLTMDEAKAIDKYAFRKSGEIFIRSSAAEPSAESPSPKPAPEVAGTTRGGSTILKPARPAEFPIRAELDIWANMVAEIFKEEGAAKAFDVWKGLDRANELTGPEIMAFRDKTHAAMRAVGWKGTGDEGPPTQSLPEITQSAADTAPPEPMTLLPPEPAVADAISLAQGKGPVPVTVEPDPTDKIRLKSREITDADLAAATKMLEDGEQQAQVDLVLDLLDRGWNKYDVSDQPGVDLTPHEVEALWVANKQDEEDREIVRPRRGTDGLQGSIRLGDEGAGSEGVPKPDPFGEDGGTPAGEVGGGTRPAGGNTRPSTSERPRGTNGSGAGRGGRTRTRGSDRLPDVGEGSEPGDAGRPPQSPDTIEGTNYVIEPGALAETRGRLTKARDNLAAIELAKRIKADGRLATRAEQEVLAKYVGWGGIKNVFRDSAGQIGKGLEDIGKRLEEILSPAEYRAANSTVNNAHYTAEHVVRSIWEAVRQMGFEGGSVFEPGMGIGHFLGLMPQDIAQKSTYRGIERDSITTDIAQLLYPRAGIRQADYTRMALPEQAFDLVIGNPPFLDVAVSSDKKYPQRFMLHDYFFAKSLDAVRPGGLLAFVTSAGTMNKLGAEGREYLAERAEFVGGIRLPSSAFRQNAMTDVTTDILFFKRRPEGKVSISKDKMPPWTTVAPRTLPNAADGTTSGNVNQYFNEHPEMVLGQEGFFDKLYPERYAVHQKPDTDLTVDLREAIDRLPRDVMTPEPTPEQKAALDFSSTEKKDGSFYVKDGTLMQYRGGAGGEVLARGKGVQGGFTAADRDRVIKLIPVRDALRQVFAADLAEDEATGAKAREKLNAAYDDFVKWFGPINLGTITFQRPSIIQQEGARAEAREEARFVGERWVEGDFDAAPMYDVNAKPGEIARARDAARQAALAAGQPFNEGSFDPADMPDIVVEKRPNIKPFMSDPESYRLRSIENYDDSTNTATKKAIFTRSILTHEEEPKINSAHDGVLWSLNKLGRFDAPAIAEKMGKTVPEIVAELGDDVFKVPGTDDTYQTKDQYLSGDVVTKLEQARRASESDPELQRNVIALESAAPRPLAPSRISMVIGMPWIPAPVVAEFASEFLQLGNPRINYSEVTGTWIVEKPSSRDRSASGVLLWGTSRRGPYDLLSDALNRTPPRVMTPGSRDNPPRFDPVATQAAQDMMAKIRDAFFDPETRSGWVLNDQTRANELADIYNGKMNREVLRQHDGSYLTTPGVAASWSWRPHQTRVVSRIILEGNTYMAHAVGAGKTSAMIGAGMEMKRLGLVRKPMYVVPNHMLGQFTKEFYEQYPTARIAVADEERFHTDRRKQFIANVAQDDLDAVIITHSSFQKVPISDEFQAGLIQEQIDMLEEAISQLDPGSDRITVGRMNKQREKLEQRLSKASGTDKDQTLTFEEMGVDFVFVDEAHLFRKLSFATKQGQMKGISPEGSNMSWDLFTKVRYLDSQRPGRSVVFASGTSITNTMGELYSLSRFMQPDALKSRGLSHFDAWAQTFGTTKSTLEETAAGTYQPVTRFGKFVNMPELYNMVGGVMDIVTPAQLEQYVTRPQLKGGERQFHMAPRSEILDRYQATLGERMEAIKARRGPPAPGDDIILSVINDGRHAAIDPRFVEQSQNDPTSKLNMMIDNVARIYHETGDVQFYDPGTGYTKPSFRGPATQMIFANLGVNGRGPMAFSGYRWIKEALRRAGVPLDQIAFIGDYGSTIARQKLFNDMNEGKIRILIGSTQKMGTGVNAQRRLIANHNQDPLWFPADDEQRNGRILRQGNHNPEIEIHDYTTKGTYDSAMWQMMAKKAGFIEQFFRGDPTLRDMEDIGEASMYEQASAMSTTDERIITLTQLKQDLDKARRRRSAHEDEQWALRTKYREHLAAAQYAKEKAERYADDISKRVETTGKKFTMQVAGETFTVRKDALEALRTAADDRAATMGDDTVSVIGNIGGFQLRLKNTKKGHWLELSTRGAWDKSLSRADPIASAEDRIRYFELDQRNTLADETRQRADAAAVEPYLNKPFEGRDEIGRLNQAVKELTAILEGEAKATERAKSGESEPEPEEDVAPTDRTREVDLDEPREVREPKQRGREIDIEDD